MCRPMSGPHTPATAGDQVSDVPSGLRLVGCRVFDTAESQRLLQKQRLEPANEVIGGVERKG
jgi:hypothetical protein